MTNNDNIFTVRKDIFDLLFYKADIPDGMARAITDKIVDLIHSRERAAVERFCTQVSRQIQAIKHRKGLPSEFAVEFHRAIDAALQGQGEKDA